jgi:hypothetical protein
MMYRSLLWASLSRVLSHTLLAYLTTTLCTFPRILVLSLLVHLILWYYPLCGSGNGIDADAMELLSPGLAQLSALESLDL